jgi:hypothetical protein
MAMKVVFSFSGKNGLKAILGHGAQENDNFYSSRNNLFQWCYEGRRTRNFIFNT